MGEEEINHRRRIGEAVGMMADAGLDDDLDLPAQRAVARFYNADVFG
jgi:hypothetical protein